MRLLVHTVTVAETGFELQAQFLHAVAGGRVRLLGRRMRLRRRRAAPKGGKTVDHHLRTINLSGVLAQQARRDEGARASPVEAAPQESGRKIEETDEQSTDQILSHSTPEQTSAWLIKNRFDKYLETFSSFSGADMLRMSREDLIQICGQADGIRLYNSVHLKTIAPKLKIYVCRENTSIFNAVFLMSHSNVELMEKLSALMGVSQDQVQDIYMEGPHSIHVQLNNDVIRHIKEETMFSVEILQENGSYVFLLKRTVK